jgi:hypothetical protein
MLPSARSVRSSQFAGTNGCGFSLRMRDEKVGCRLQTVALQPSSLDGLVRFLDHTKIFSRLGEFASPPIRPAQALFPAKPSPLHALPWVEQPA